MSLIRIDDDVAQTAIISLSILKSIATLYGAEQAIQHMPIETGWDTVMDLYFFALESCADRLYMKYDGRDGTEVTGIENDDMTEYFKLAYKYGELKGLPEKENSFLTDANAIICNTLGNINNYNFDYCLKNSKRRKPRLLLIIYQEYYPNAEVIYQLYKLLGFFKRAMPLLDSELKSMEKSCKKAKKICINKKRRKAA